MLLMLEEEIRGAICQAILKYTKKIINIWVIMIKILCYPIR